MTSIDNDKGIKRSGSTRGQDDRRLTSTRFATLAITLSFLGACATPVTKTVPPKTSSVNNGIAEMIELVERNACAQPNDLALNSVVRVASVDGSDGSGVVIASDRVLTAAHVVDDSFRALVFIDNAYRPAQVLAVDPAADLALLEVATGILEPIQVSQSHLLRWEPVWTVGFPLAMEKVANLGFYKNHVDGAIYASASTNAGASGGGLLRCHDGVYELAGMIRGYGAYWRGGQLERIEDLSISVPANAITNFALNAGLSL